MASPAHGDRPEAPAEMRVFLLGDFQVTVRNDSISSRDWRLRKSSSLVKILALTPGYQLHRDQLVELLWPDLPLDSALNNFHQALYVARRSLNTLVRDIPATRILRLDRHVVSLGLHAQLWVDVEHFERTARRASQTGSAEDHRAAIELYRGDLLSEDRYEDWASSRREALRRMFHTVLLSLANLYEERGEANLAADTLRRLLASEPTHEDAHIGLMRIYANTGMQRQALAQYESLRAELRNELDIEPRSATTRLYRQILEGEYTTVPKPVTIEPASQSTGRAEVKDSPADDDAPRRPDGAPTNLPIQLTRLIGREREIEEIQMLLTVSRLLTLTGPGGVGKTRLALAVGSELLDSFFEGVYVVSLATVRNPALVVSAIAQVFGVREKSGQELLESLKHYLADKRLLLLFDNFEHLALAGPIVTDLLGYCPNLQVLITSRMRLRLHGEQEYPVPPLSLPDLRRLPPTDALIRYGSVALFVQRSREVRPSFRITRETAPTVAEISHRLDGLPLAIELAAARTKVLTPHSMLARLDRPLDLLTDGPRDQPRRLQTIRDTIAWSYDLLDSDEQQLFQHLSVFVGGWTLEAAEAIAQVGPFPDSEVLEGLTTLVDHSLVHQAPVADGLRFSMLETVREFASEQLAASGEAAAIHQQHATYFTNLAEKAGPALFGLEQETWLDRLQQELGNLRAALYWCLQGDGDIETGLRLAGSLWMFWDIRGFLAEGRRWLESLAERSQTRSEPYAQARFAAGYLATRQGDPASARPLLEEALALYREFGDKQGTGRTLGMLGAIVSFEGDFERSTAFLEEALTMFRESGDSLDIARTLLDLGDQVRVEGDYQRARILLEESLARLRRLGFERAAGWALANLGNISRAEGNDEHAMPFFIESRDIFDRLGDKRGLSRPVLYLANLARRRGDFATAYDLLRESLVLLREIEDQWRLPVWVYYAGLLATQRDEHAGGARLISAARASSERFESLLDPAERADGDNALAACRTALGEDEFNWILSAGRIMTLDQAIAFALESFDAPST